LVFGQSKQPNTIAAIVALLIIFFFSTGHFTDAETYRLIH
jgi:hypothetical protein